MMSFLFTVISKYVCFKPISGSLQTEFSTLKGVGLRPKAVGISCITTVPSMTLRGRGESELNVILKSLEMPPKYLNQCEESKMTE